jgi:hypothetical protein
MQAKIDQVKAKADKTELKSKTKTVFHVDYGDMERYIKKITGKNIEIGVLLESGNDTSHEFNVDQSGDRLFGDDQADAEAFLFGDKKEPAEYSFYDIMSVMCLHGLIEEGHYIIRVSW